MSVKAVGNSPGHGRLFLVIIPIIGPIPVVALPLLDSGGVDHLGDKVGAIVFVGTIFGIPPVPPLISVIDGFLTVVAVGFCTQGFRLFILSILVGVLRLSLIGGAIVTGVGFLCLLVFRPGGVARVRIGVVRLRIFRGRILVLPITGIGWLLRSVVISRWGLFPVGTLLLLPGRTDVTDKIVHLVLDRLLLISGRVVPVGFLLRRCAFLLLIRGRLLLFRSLFGGVCFRFRFQCGAKVKGKQVGQFHPFRFAQSFFLRFLDQRTDPLVFQLVLVLVYPFGVINQGLFLLGRDIIPLGLGWRRAVFLLLRFRRVLSSGHRFRIDEVPVFFVFQV